MPNESPNESIAPAVDEREARKYRIDRELDEIQAGAFAVLFGSDSAGAFAQHILGSVSILRTEIEEEFSDE